MGESKTRLVLGDIATSFLLPLERVLSAQGLPPQHLLERYGLHAPQLVARDNRISIPKFMRIGHEAIRLSKNPRLGLAMGQHSLITDSNLAGLAALSAPTIGEAITTLTRFQRLNSVNARGHSRFYLENADESGIFHFYSISPYNAYNYFVVDFMLASMATLCEWLSGKNGLLRRVEIEYEAPPDSEIFESIFDCPVQFSAPRNALTLRPGKHAVVNRFANQGNFLALTQLCQERTETLQRGQSFKQKVVELIGPELSSQHISIERIARKMGLASWSLRRRLGMEGYRFQDLLDETRCEMAKSYVRDTQHSFTEIAYLLGFANPSGFQRAFKRWTGLSPGEFRAATKPEGE